MIHVVTVHWKTDKWVPVQLHYLERFANAPYRVYASLNGIDDPDIKRRFYYSADLDGSHGQKLNALAQTVLEEAEPNDILIFLDGDAFPVQSLQPWLDETLSSHPLVAIQRVENCDDTRAHPSFCATTAGFWKEHGCDWTPVEWVSSSGTEFLDAGGRLAQVLEANDVKWLPLRRTNTRNLHPLWFAIYGHRLYHHGAGFRRRISKVDQANKHVADRVTTADASLGQLSMKIRHEPSALLKVRPLHVRQLLLGARRSLSNRLSERFESKASAQADEVFEKLSSDDRFYNEFDSTVP
jgi:hypothetical protein